MSGMLRSREKLRPYPSPGIIETAGTPWNSVSPPSPKPVRTDCSCGNLKYCPVYSEANNVENTSPNSVTPERFSDKKIRVQDIVAFS